MALRRRWSIFPGKDKPFQPMIPQISVPFFPLISKCFLLLRVHSCFPLDRARGLGSSGEEFWPPFLTRALAAKRSEPARIRERESGRGKYGPDLLHFSSLYF